MDLKYKIIFCPQIYELVGKKQLQDPLKLVVKTDKEIISIIYNLIFDKEAQTMEFIDVMDLQMSYLAALFIFLCPGASAVPGTKSGIDKYLFMK